MKERKLLFRLVVDIYTNFYRQVSLNSDFKFSCSDRDAKMINNFLDKIYHVGLGKNELIDYFEFSLNYWISLETKFGKGNIQLNWLIGDKAYKRWTDRHKHSFKYFIRIGIKKAVEIKQKRESKLNNIILKIVKHEEELKGQFFNSTKGFVFCVGNTLLYNHKSVFCSTCKNMLKCKSVLKQEYPKIYKLRGYV